MKRDPGFVNSARLFSSERDFAMKEKKSEEWTSALLRPKQQEQKPSTSIDIPELTSTTSRTTSQSSISLSAITKKVDYQTTSSTLLSASQHSIHDDSGVRRLLSGEVRTLSGGEQVQNDATAPELSNLEMLPVAAINAQESEETDDTDCREDGELNVSFASTSLRQDASVAKTEEEGKAAIRRMNEALQFAQAVGEQISMNQEDLMIIDDDEDDDDDDDDDDDGCEAEEVAPSKGMIALNASFHEEVLSAEFPARSIPNTPNKLMNQSLVEPETPLAIPVMTHTPKSNRRRKARPMWPFEDLEFNFMEHLSDGGDRTNFVYKGICANPPEITKRGIQRGNYAQLHRKAWLEVSDKYHRYGKNLRLYYRLWERNGFPTNQFFDWLDSKGEAAGQPLPNIEECPRSVLDSDTVLYITNPSVTDRYALNILPGDDGRGLVVDVDGDPVCTGPDGWIFILRDNVVYGAPKITSVTGHSKQRFHHSSFFGGKAVASAGIIITDNQGYMTRLYPHSGHYRPGEAHMQRMLFFLHKNGIDLRTFDMDTQQLLHVSREKEDPKKKDKTGEGKPAKNKEEKKMKKVDSLHLERAADVACFLAHKAELIGKGVFDKIHRIRKADVTSVSEALRHI